MIALSFKIIKSYTLISSFGCCVATHKLFVVFSIRLSATGGVLFQTNTDVFCIPSLQSACKCYVSPIPRY